LGGSIADVNAADESAHYWVNKVWGDGESHVRKIKDRWLTLKATAHPFGAVAGVDY